MFLQAIIFEMLILAKEILILTKIVKDDKIEDNKTMLRKYYTPAAKIGIVPVHRCHAGPLMKIIYFYQKEARHSHFGLIPEHL